MIAKSFMDARVFSPILRQETERFCEALLRCYAIIFFSSSRLFGAILLAATLAAPRFGLFGLAGVFIAYVATRLFGFEQSNVQNGMFLFNSLLVSLALAYLESYQSMGWLTLSVLLLSSSVGTLLVSVAMADIFPRYFALPTLSLPFVAVGFMLFYLFHALSHIPLVPVDPVFLVPVVGNLPDLATGFLQALGAIFFLPNTTVGLMVLAGMTLWSRLAVLYAVTGYLSGILFMQGLGMATQPETLGSIGFNFIFCGLALGGIFLVPSRGSLLMAVLGSWFCAIVAAAARTALNRLGIPPLALPLNLVILGGLYALKCRPRIKHLIETACEPDRPEAYFRWFAVESARFPGASQPHLQSPFFGERTITQGFDGELTHRGQWSDALDYEIVDKAGNKFSHLPLDLEGNHIFGTPVLAPCSGIVVKVVDDVPDNAVGEINTDRNWGNLVIIRNNAGWYVKLCHLQQGSVKNHEGEWVRQGQVIGCCGNSGRSPVPHLHMQAQYSELIGGHTIPFRLAHYFTTTGTGLRYHASGVPGRGHAVSPAGFDPKVAACFEFSEKSKTFRFNGRNETVNFSFNTMGDRILSTGSASLTARIKDQTFYTSDYKGGCDSFLFLIHLGLARVPFVSGDNISWNDQVDLSPLLRPWVVSLLNLAGPFVGYPLAEVEYRLIRSDENSFRIFSSFKYPVPRSLLRPDCPGDIAVSLSSEGINEIRLNACEY